MAEPKRLSRHKRIYQKAKASKTWQEKGNNNQTSVRDVINCLDELIWYILERSLLSWTKSMAIKCKPISSQKTHHNHYKCWSSPTFFLDFKSAIHLLHLKCLKHKGLVTRYSTGWSTGSKGNFQEIRSRTSIYHNKDATMHLKFHRKTKQIQHFLLKKTLLFHAFPWKTPPQRERKRDRDMQMHKKVSQSSQLVIGFHFGASFTNQLCLSAILSRKHRSDIAFASLGVRRLCAFCLNKIRLVLGGVGRPAETGPLCCSHLALWEKLWQLVAMDMDILASKSIAHSANGPWDKSLNFTFPKFKV